MALLLVSWKAFGYLARAERGWQDSTMLMDRELFVVWIYEGAMSLKVYGFRAQNIVTNVTNVDSFA
jgi:hypothetical protein